MHTRSPNDVNPVATVDRGVPAHKVLALAPSRAEVELSVEESLACLVGHFPMAPIVPGAAQLSWSIALARQLWGIESRVSLLEGIKFQRPIQPPVAVRLSLEYDAPTRTLSFIYRSANVRYSSGRLVFAT